MTLTLSPREIVEKAESRSSHGLLSRAPHWSRVQLGEIARVINGAAYPSRRFNTEQRGMPLIRIRDVGSDKLSTWFDGDWERKHLVRHGDLLVGMDGDFRVATWAHGDALLNQRVCRIETTTDTYDRRFLHLVLQGYLDAIWAETSSTTVKHISSRSIADIPLPLPPLEEQRRIVAILDDHLSRLDAADASLTTGARRLAALERAALAECRDGELRPLAEVATIQGGIQKQQKRAPKHNAFPFLRVANVTARGLDLSEVHQVELFTGELDRLRLQRGDLLVVEGNGSASQIGRAATWDGSIDDCVHQNHLIRVRPSEALIPEYLEAVWNSPQSRSALTDIASSSSGLHTLSVSKLKRLSIPVPTIDRQESLVVVVKEIREAKARMLSAIAGTQRRSAALRRSLLAAAFSGRLTGSSAEMPEVDGIHA